MTERNGSVPSRYGNVKVVGIVGARPQFIKAVAVSRVLRAEPGVQEVPVYTGLVLFGL